MTDSEIVNTQRTINQNKEMGRNSQLLNLDLQKWNPKFQQRLVYPFGRVLDQLFGSNHLFRFSHLWFVNCNIFSNHRLCPPNYNEDGDPINGKYFYNYHLGGLEGMHQKKWTWITLSTIRYTYI
jgi:hypothetical protein